VEPARPPVSRAGFWDGLYAAGQDGWDLGEASPALVDWLDAGGRFEPAPGEPRGLSADWGSARAISGPPQMKSLTEANRSQPAPRNVAAPAPARVAVPGAGRGHDARLLARRGYRVTAFDFAEAAVAEARRLAAAEAVELTVEPRDVFTLPRDHAGAFDGVWEYTCFCAIDPARRDEYASVLHAILRPGGVLLACFFPLRDGTDGPPFPVSRDEIARVLAGRFTVLEAGPPPRSVERRRGLEWLVRARRDPAAPGSARGRAASIDRPRPA
jgi:SAM-dependent methyltransferase